MLQSEGSCQMHVYNNNVAWVRYPGALRHSSHSQQMADIEELSARRAKRQRCGATFKKGAYAGKRRFNRATMGNHLKPTNSSLTYGVVMPNYNRFHGRDQSIAIHSVHPPACNASKYLDPYSLRGCCNPGMKYPFKDERPKSARMFTETENEVKIRTQFQLGSIRERASGMALSLPTNGKERLKAWEAGAKTAPF